MQPPVRVPERVRSAGLALALPVAMDWAGGEWRRAVAAAEEEEEEEEV